MTHEHWRSGQRENTKDNVGGLTQLHHGGTIQLTEDVVSCRRAVCWGVRPGTFTNPWSQPANHQECCVSDSSPVAICVLFPYTYFKDARTLRTHGVLLYA